MTPRAALFLLAAFAGAPVASGQQLLFEVHGTNSEGLGSTSAAPGDLDGDGRPDVAVGIPGWPGGGGSAAGAVAAYSSATGQLIWMRSGSAAGEALGYALGVVGDVDGDGVTDVGAGLEKIFSGQSGKLRVLSGANGTVLLELSASTVALGTGLGRGGICGADVDLDGTPDVIAGAPYASVAGLTTGAVCVFSGATGMHVQTVLPSAPSSNSARVVCAAGDWNQDGTDDFAYSRSSGSLSTGTVDVVGGNGFATLAQLMVPAPQFAPNVADAESIGDVDGDGILDLALGIGGTNVAPFLAGGVAIFRGGYGTVLQIAQDASDPAFGLRIAPVGDLNGDSVPDVAVSTGPIDEGAFVAVRSGATGTELLRIPGVTDFGESLAGVGDWDGDGSPDLAIGTPAFGQSSTGKNCGFLGVYSLAGSSVCDPIVAYGPACGPPGYFATVLQGIGCPAAGGPFRIDFKSGLLGPSASAFIIAGTQAVSIPIGGNGCRILVGPPPGVWFGPLPLSFPYSHLGSGGYDLVIPDPLPPGTYKLQVVITDGSALGSSNGISFDVL